MDIIYSRPRIKFPKLFANKEPNNKFQKKVNKITFILFFTFMTIGISITAVTPTFNDLCNQRAKGKATIIINEETQKVIRKYNYSDFIKIHKDNEGNILMLETNIINVNKVISEVTKEIQDRIDNSSGDEIKIRLGTFTGINLLAGRGIGVPIKIATIGNITNEVKSEFINQGINQTLHRVYLNMECEIGILTPFNTLKTKTENQIIIAENIIVGNIPESYYNFEDLQTSDTINLTK